jgi:hypothetical protein
MQYSGFFAFFWYSLERTTDQPLSPREAEIAQLEHHYRGAHVPLTAAQVALRFAALVVMAVLVALGTTLVLTPA